MNHEFWYLSRAAGFTAYLLLFCSVALGITTSTRLGARLVRQNTVFDVHRFLSILALGFVTMHVYILLGDGYFNYDVWQLSLPLLSPYRMWQVAAGSFAAYALIVIVTSFYVRRFIGYRVWRAIHFITFALFAAAMLHGIMAGSDTSQAWARAIYLGTGVAVLLLIAYRLQYRLPPTDRARQLRFAAGGATAVAALVLVAGTGLLWHGSATNGGATGIEAAKATGYRYMPSFDTQLAGSYTRSEDGTTSHLVIDATTSGDLAAALHIEIASQGSNGVTANRAELLDPASLAVLCDGQLTAFRGSQAAMTCDGSGPYRGIRITIRAQFDASDDGSLTGELSGQMARTS